METLQKTTEVIVRETLGQTYERFAFNEDISFIEDIVELLENPVAARIEDSLGTSHAAAEIRSRLWRRYSGGIASAQATTDLFVAMGRQDELGWV